MSKHAHSRIHKSLEGSASLNLSVTSFILPWHRGLTTQRCYIAIPSSIGSMLNTEPRRGKLYKGKKACALSAALKANPSLFDGKKLSLVGLDIHFIDILPSKIVESVKTIYLSNNYLVNLANLDQFSKAEAASLMNNSIRYLDELQTLSCLKNLKSLSLQGNVVSKMPFYREHVVCMCPSLTLLDDEKVTADYREKCQSKLLVISTFYDYLRVNELRNGVLVHICKMMECHVEIYGKFGRGNCFR